MKSLLLLIALVALATPSLGKTDAEKQHDVNYLLWKVDAEQRDATLRGLETNYNPLSHKDHYTDGGRAIDLLMHELEAGRLLEQKHWFSLFNTRQRKEAVMLYDVLEHVDDWDNFVGNAAYFRKRMNEGQFVYALYAAVIHSPLTRHVVLPPLYEVTPQMFTNSEVVHQAYTAKMTNTPGKFVSHFTGTKKNPEQRVAYFGEDVGMNTHHVMWHLEFPFWWDDSHEDHHIDRKGENFFWVHHQLTVRFDAERLSNYLSPVDELHWDDEIVEGFAPHTMYKYGGAFPSRPDHVHFEDVDGVARIRDMLITESRIRDAIAHGYITDKDGSHIDIRGDNGIDILGDVIESSTYSPNVRYYGSLHNTAHVMLGRQHDPHNKYDFPPSVMEHFETATRDPSFFRLHKYMDNIFREYKDSLTPYTKEDLEFSGVAITGVNIEGTLETYFEDYEYSLLCGIDDTTEIEDVEAIAITKRLNHKEFSTHIEVSNNNDAEVEAVVRIFAWPHEDNNGVEFSFDEGRWNAIEMDKYWVKLSPGANSITRKSTESSLTVPDVPHFQTLMDKADAGGDMGLEEFESATGIPNRFLLPKGKVEGMEFDLVVFLSNGVEDANMPDLATTTAFTHYGYHGTYPDKRPHGYPLDRHVEDERVFEDLDNFKHTSVKVFFHEE